MAGHVTLSGAGLASPAVVPVDADASVLSAALAAAGGLDMAATSVYVRGLDNQGAFEWRVTFDIMLRASCVADAPQRFYELKAMIAQVRARMHARARALSLPPRRPCRPCQPSRRATPRHPSLSPPCAAPPVDARRAAAPSRRRRCS